MSRAAMVTVTTCGKLREFVLADILITKVTFQALGLPPVCNGG